MQTQEDLHIVEQVIRTLEEQLIWARTFQWIKELRYALHEWLLIYDEQWLVGQHGLNSPALDRRILLTTQEFA